MAAASLSSSSGTLDVPGAMQYQLALPLVLVPNLPSHKSHFALKAASFADRFASPTFSSAGHVRRAGKSAQTSLALAIL
jgi:hypothetical protein